uniref:Uncharacterized protein n=1 Tax=Arundo donax TaxID=35708 RepID=A0A0A9G8H7_ARUDO
MLIIYLLQMRYLKGHRATVDILLFFVKLYIVLLLFLLFQCFRFLICSIHWHL